MSEQEVNKLLHDISVKVEELNSLINIAGSDGIEIDILKAHAGTLTNPKGVFLYYTAKKDLLANSVIFTGSR